MIDIDQYVEDATRTESTKETIITDPAFLAATLQIFIAAGTMLDQIKKNVFYDREYDIDKLKTEFKNIVLSLDEIQPSLVHLEKLQTKMVGNINEDEIDVDPRVFHAVVGTATEATEMVEALVKSFQPDTNLDDVNMLEEVGDVMWYFAILLDAMGGDLEKIMGTNIAKLKARFPEKFTNEEANTRDLETERAILEKNELD